MMAAFDTENKRRSALNTALYRNLPIADGSIDLGDRAMMLCRYAFDTFNSPVLDLFKPQIKNLKQSGVINSEKQKYQVKWQL